jgi:hypothetical protein
MRRKYWTFADVATVNYALMPQHKIGALLGPSGRTIFHNLRWTNFRCNSKAKMSALSKVGMSVFYLLVVRFGGYGSDECGADEQVRAESD